MEVKGITPVAASSPIRDQRPQAAQQTASGPGTAPAAPTSEIGGRLARNLLAASGVKEVDLTKYKVNLDIDGDTGRVVAEIRDRRSGDLVSEVPSRTLLRQAAMLNETLGTILDKPV